METRIGGESHFLYGVGSMDLRAIGKRSMEWDPNEWKWDGDLFVASPLTSNPCIYRSRQFFPLETRSALAGTSSNSSSTSSDEVNLGFDKGKKEVDKRRRVIVVEHDNLEDEPGSLSLKLGGLGDYHMTEREVGNWNGACGKKTKFTGTGLNRVLCQVDDCGSDLSKAKDYHRRHKVCEMHSKASKALVGSVMQRFCQQCSRFHVLQEFDEGKRSCRRRLAGHNKRRRKTQPDTVVNNSSLNDNHASGYVLLSLLKILSNLHSTVNHKDDKDVLSLLLRSLAKSDAASGDKYISSLLQASQTLLNNGPSNTNPEMVSALFSNGHQRPLFSKQQQCNVPSSGLLQKKLHFNDEKDEDIQALPSQMPGPHSHMLYSSSSVAEAKDRSVGRSRLHNFDLNDICIDSDDCREDTDRFPVPGDQGNGSLEYPSWLGQDSQQSSPPQTSRTSDSGSTQSPSSSNNDAQSRTDRIVFKLFGKEPSDFPFVLRAQILDWLAHSPTEIESYIRPGCVVLTIYLHLPESAWIELRGDLCSSLSRLLDVSGEDTFWRTGWVYVRVQSQIAFIYNGQVVVTTSLPSKSKNYSSIVSIKPIAVSPSEKAQFTVQGFNIPRQSTRFLCALEGSYLAQEDNNELDFVDGHKVHDGLQFLNVCCSIPAVTGRGFIEVEDNGLSSSFFPFIVAQKDVCSEICMLESEIELTQTDDIQREVGQVDARSRAMDFIHEMGWLLHRSHLKSRLGYLDPNVELFSFKRFQWLIEFSMDRNWCAVVKKLLDIFVAGIVSARDHRSLRDALLEVGLLHRAVRRNSRPLVEVLLKYVPGEVADGFILDQKCMVGANEGFLFRPDAAGPAGLTPLHVVAGRDGSEDILDALTDDPGKVGVEAWRNVRDSTGSTPEDYARLRGHYCYIHLVQKKINLRPATKHVVLDIPSPLLERESNANQNQKEGAITFHIGLARQSCRFCDRVVASRNGSRSLLYKPAMLSMVAIAAICVCVALLFKSSPEVVYIFGPFRWERLDLGTI